MDLKDLCWEYSTPITRSNRDYVVGSFVADDNSLPSLVEQKELADFEVVMYVPHSVLNKGWG